MQCRWIKVCAVWPYQSVNLRIDPHLIKQLHRLQWTKKTPSQHGLKINELLLAIIEMHSQYVWRFDGKRYNAND